MTGGIGLIIFKVQILCRLHLNFGNYEQSVDDAKSAIKMNFSSISARQNLGEALYSSGEFESALLHFYRAAR